MKVPKAVRLKSGSWRVQIQIDGTRHSCTGKTKKEAQDKAKQLFAGIEMEKKVPMTIGKAIDKYIEEKKGTLSPATIQGYKKIRRNDLQSLMDILVSELTQSDAQIAVSEDAIKGKSPKTIRNAHGLLTAVLGEFRPNFVLRTRLPQKEKIEMRILTENEMKKVWTTAKGTKYELPILLASWTGLRMSEIRGLKFSDIQNGRMHIQRAIVYGPNGDAEKGTKTTSGNRWIKLPKEILKLIEASDYESDYICPYTSSMIYKGFKKICEEAGVEACTFHALRHFAASEAMALGVPDKYSMQRMGHRSDNMLKNVYQHTQQAMEDEFADMIDERMEELYNK